MTFCICNPTYVDALGGMSAGGSAVVVCTGHIIEGGIKPSGSANVDVLQDTYDGMSALWPLDETSSPYLDLSRKGLDGTARLAPTRVDGVMCHYAQYFNEGSIYCDNDDLRGPYSCSMWLNITDELDSKTLFSRATERESVTQIGYTILRQVYLDQTTIDGDESISVAAFSNMLSQDRWYHIAVEWDGTEARVYVDGVLSGTSNTTGYTSVGTPTKIGIGELQTSSQPDASLQEIHLFPEVKGTDYWKVEHDNACLAGFFIDGPVEDLTPT